MDDRTWIDEAQRNVTAVSDDELADTELDRPPARLYCQFPPCSPPPGRSLGQYRRERRKHGWGIRH